jgi:hypothetical protein
LFPSKAGNETVGQNVIAAAESGARFKRQLENNIAELLFEKDEISAKRVAAYEAYMSAEARSERARNKEIKKPNNKINENDPSAF